MARLVSWWELPRQPGRQGDLVRVKGEDRTISCPKCKGAPVVYNGNYFCDRYDDSCDWALAHPARSEKDRAFCDLVGIGYE